MRVREAMTSDAFVAEPDQTVEVLARAMRDLDIGALPVGENDKLIGIVTDRDIAVRIVAAGKGPETAAREAMSTDIKYCFEDEETEAVALNMSTQQLKRLPVVDRDKRLVGIVSLADIAGTTSAQTVGDAVAGISRPDGAPA